MIIKLALLWSLLINLVMIMLSMSGVVKNPAWAVLHLFVNLVAVLALVTFVILKTTVEYFM
jgi:hypothetical protein